MKPEAFFLPSGHGAADQRFCLYYRAQGGAAKGLVLYIHPFAEEMNKSRRMAALQARAMAQAGYAVLQIDLLGCGDSAGDFQDASWQSWVNDVVRGCHWLRSRNNTSGAAPDQAPLWLWGLRAGCLLAVEAASRLNEPCHLLFWQPPSAGKPLLQQFLRLKVAGEMLGGHAKGVMEGMRQQLAAGSAVEISGYMLTPALATGLEQAVLVPPACRVPAGRLEWFELSTQEGSPWGLASTKTIEQWQQAGFKVCSHKVRGPAFWQTSEIEDAPALIAATTAALTETVSTRPLDTACV